MITSLSIYLIRGQLVGQIAQLIHVVTYESTVPTLNTFLLPTLNVGSYQMFFLN